jgi:hypothetical protein
MDINPKILIDHLGGVSAVAKLLKAPTSTVFSWTKNGIPASRMEHLRLAAKSIKTPLPDDLAALQSPTQGRAA